ncbi:hypothetical protein ACIQZI_09750 [Peribacillus sp. NPDC096379]|uniref:hypothetical protein n=1 Tax=Peribacillus sp. NPDC096379 TaxID=3364393 RepID=UPI0037FFA0B8
MRKIMSLFFVFLIGCTFLISTTYASWAYAFVVYDGNIYVVSETHIKPNKIGKKIGKVTKYSDREGTYSGNFSNQFPKETDYYEIKGATTKEAIAIKESKESFIKAKYDGKYTGSGEYDHKKYILNNLLVYFIGVVLLFGIIYLFYKRRSK